jgi:hypothetical protein
MNEPAGAVERDWRSAMEIWPLVRARMGKQKNRWGYWLGGQQEVAGRIAGGDGD